VGEAVFVRGCQYLSVLDGINSDGGRYFPRNVGKHVPDYFALHRKVSGGWRDGWVRSWRLKRKRPWSYRDKTRNFPGGTGETHEKCQHIQCPRRHSNSAFLEYKSDLLLHLSACLEKWSDVVITVMWVVLPYGRVELYWRFRGTCCLLVSIDGQQYCDLLPSLPCSDLVTYPQNVHRSNWLKERAEILFTV
jgi:hypothetical protein